MTAASSESYTIKHSEIAQYLEKLKSTIDHYHIHESYFRHPVDKVIHGALRLMAEYKLDNEFTEDPERNLFMLAVTDEWLSTTKLSEKKPLIDILKLIAYGESDNGWINLSGKVRDMAKAGSHLGTRYDPEADNNNDFNKRKDSILQYIDDNLDQELTARIKNHLFQWNITSPLTKVRSHLHISPETEKPFQIKVLSKTKYQMEYGDGKDIVGTRAFVILIDKNPIMVLASDITDDISVIEHEYAHSQAVGLTIGYMDVLFRALDEAVTESCTEGQINYPDALQIYHRIVTDHPDLKELFIGAYKNGGDYRKELITELIKYYKLFGFLALTRLDPKDSNPNSIYISSHSLTEQIF